VESKKDMHETFGSSEEVFRRVTVVVEQLTKASAPRGMVGVEEHLAQAPLSELKQLVRSSDATMHHVIHILLRRIALPHSLKRLRALLLMDVLFTRSKLARSLLVPQLQTVLQYTVSGVGGRPLPPPKDAAALLRTKAISILENWDSKFGDSYRQLRLGVHFVKNQLAVSAAGRPDPGSDDRMQRQRRALQVAQQDTLQQQFVQIQDQVSGVSQEIQACVHQMGRCFPLLTREMVQANDWSEGALDADQESDSVDEWEDNEWNESSTPSVSISDDDPPSSDPLRGYRSLETEPGSGAWEDQPGSDDGGERASCGVGVEIDFDPQPAACLKGSAVLHAIRDLHRELCVRHRPRITQWMEVCMQVDDERAPGKERLIGDLVRLKHLCTESLERCELLGIMQIEPPAPATQALPADPDPDFCPRPPERPQNEIQNCSHSRTVRSEDAGHNSNPPRVSGGECSKPCAFDQSRHGDVPSVDQRANSSAAADVEIKALAQSDSSHHHEGLRKQLLDQAPVLPGGEHLDYWGQEARPSNARGLELEGHWGRFDTDVMMPTVNNSVPGLSGNLRTSYYTADSNTSIPACRAPLRDGKLCTRRDRRNCPFHGPVVPRDDSGMPIDPTPEAPHKVPAALIDTNYMTQRQRDMVHNESVLARSAHLLVEALPRHPSLKTCEGVEPDHQLKRRRVDFAQTRHPSPKRRERIEAKMVTRKESRKSARQRMHRMQVNQTS